MQDSLVPFSTPRAQTHHFRDASGAGNRRHERKGWDFLSASRFGTEAERFHVAWFASAARPTSGTL